MTVQRRARVVLPVTLCVVSACFISTSLSGCAASSPSGAGGVDGTTLPTPSSRPVPPGRILAAQLEGLRKAKVLAVDEDLQTGRQEVEVRLALGAHGSVVDATTLPIGSGSGPGYEVFRSPNTLLQRPAGTAGSCWSVGGPEAGRYDVPVAPEVAVLQSVRATSVRGGVLHGVVSARALLGLLGTPAELRNRGLDPATDADVPATFSTSADSLEVMTAWSSLRRLAGAEHGATGTWTVRYRAFGAAGPSAPAADMMCP